MSKGVTIGTGRMFRTSPSQCDTPPAPKPNRMAAISLLAAFIPIWCSNAAFKIEKSPYRAIQSQIVKTWVKVRCGITPNSNQSGALEPTIRPTAHKPVRVGYSGHNGVMATGEKEIAPATWPSLFIELTFAVLVQGCAHGGYG